MKLKMMPWVIAITMLNSSAFAEIDNVRINTLKDRHALAIQTQQLLNKKNNVC